MVTVVAGQNADLGEIVFMENRVGPITWEIGIPDRTAMEYKHGDHFNQWGLPYKFPQEFPNGIQYYIGKLDYSKDWNYCHVSVPGKGGKCQSIPWNIYFNLDQKTTGTSILRVSIAANSSTALSISLNGGKNSAEVSNFKDDACVHRDGIRGFYRELEFPLNANDFKIGENKITLNARKIGGYNNNYQFDGIMYDHIRLETPELIEILIMIIIIVTITATITITITMLEIILVVGQYLLDIHVVLTIQQYIILMIMEIGEFKTITGVVFK